MPYVYASILVGGILIIFYALIFIFEDLKEIAAHTADAPVEQK